MEGWGEVGEGFGVGDWGTVKKMGVLSNAIFLWNRGINFNLVSIGLFEYSFIRHVLWCVIPN